MASLHRRPAVVAQVEDASLDAKPATNEYLMYHNMRQSRAAPTTRDSEPSKHRCDWKFVSSAPAEIRPGSPYVFPRAGRPTITIAILPEWNNLPDMVLYSWAGAMLPWSSGTS
jgi:hypothetical protein